MERIMQEINNFFENSYEQGAFSITDDEIVVTGKYVRGQYIRIVDSILNDGVYKIIRVQGQTITLEKELLNEDFEGYIVGLAVPRNFIDICNKISEFNNNNKGIASESIPNYSISYDTTYKSGLEKYAKDLAIYRKPYTGKYAWMKHLR